MIDDEWFTIGSANLNDRGLVTDGELNVISIDAAVARELRCALWGEHLGMSKEQVASVDPIALFDTTWRESAARNAKVMENGHAPLRSSVRRYVCDEHPGSGLLKRVQSLTLER